MLSFDDINDKTGFANGEKWVLEQEVRDYFTVESMKAMFAGNLADYPDLTNQELLNQMADAVIGNRWHKDETIASQRLVELKEYTGDNEWMDIIWGEDLDESQTDEIAGESSDAAAFVDGSAIKFDRTRNEWVLA